MKPIPFKVTEKQNASFHLQINRQGQYDKFHFHPEYQLSLIVAGQGIASLGHQMTAYRAGDIFLMGPNLPHVFRPQEESVDEPTQMMNLFFNESSLGNGFFHLPEMSAVREFLLTCDRGVKLGPSLSDKLRPFIQDLEKETGAPRIIKLLSILHEMATSEEKVYFAAGKSLPPDRYGISNRLQRIFNYITDNFDKPISLEEAAEVANLSKYAFCRYFKRYTHKSFVRYLNEFRISVACKYLMRNSYTVLQVSMLTGFNNLSNFNRQFKRFMHCTPTEYRASFRGHP